MRPLAAALCLAALTTPAAAAPTGALKARVGYAAGGAVDSLQAREGEGGGIALASSPVHGALGGFYGLSEHVQLGVMAGYGRYLDPAEGDAETTAISVLPTLRLLSNVEGTGAYGELGLGYSYLNQAGAEAIDSHGWQAQAEGGVAVALIGGLRAEVGVAFSFRMGSNRTADGPTGSASFAWDLPDVRLGLSYAL